MKSNIDTGSAIKVLQITDCHLGSDLNEELLGLNVDTSLGHVLDHIAVHEETPDLVLITGDISSNSQPKAYERLLQRMAEVFPNTPFACLPGNHDSVPSMEAFLPAKHLHKSLDLGEWLVLMLDSSIPEHEHGNLCDTELEFLNSTLNDNPTKNVIVCLHHQPVTVGCNWIDQYIVRSADSFLEIIGAHKNVKAVLWGHVHQVFEQQREHALFMSAPSTCVQFKPDSYDFALDRKMPGYRWMDLNHSGQLETRVERIADRDYPIDYDSNGY